MYRFLIIAFLSILVDLVSLMLYNKIQPGSFLDSREEDFLSVFLPYLGIGAILLNVAEPFKQIDNTSLTEGPK